MPKLTRCLCVCSNFSLDTYVFASGHVHCCLTPGTRTSISHLNPRSIHKAWEGRHSSASLAVGSNLEGMLRGCLTSHKNIGVGGKRRKTGTSFITFSPVIMVLTQNVGDLLFQVCPLLDEKGFEQGYSTSPVNSLATCFN